jgi:hypothetical protein
MNLPILVLRNVGQVAMGSLDNTGRDVHWPQQQRMVEERDREVRSGGASMQQ